MSEVKNLFKPKNSDFFFFSDSSPFSNIANCVIYPKMTVNWFTYTVLFRPQFKDVVAKKQPVLEMKY